MSQYRPLTSTLAGIFGELARRGGEHVGNPDFANVFNKNGQTIVRGVAKIAPGAVALASAKTAAAVVVTKAAAVAAAPVLIPTAVVAASGYGIYRLVKKLDET